MKNSESDFDASSWQSNDLPPFSYAHDEYTQFMETQGFEVQRHYHLDTAWVATYTHHGPLGGGHTAVPVLGVNSEMDALPGIGHACGHNLIGVAGVAVACAVKAALETLGIGGKVVLLGTPGERRSLSLSKEGKPERTFGCSFLVAQVRRAVLARYCCGTRGRMRGWTFV